MTIARFNRLLALSVALMSAIAAQPGPTLSGQVKDPQGKPVPRADVRLFRQDTTDFARTATNGEGWFSFDRQAAGPVLLQIDKEGFRGSASNIAIKSNTPSVANITLEVAGVSDSVVVTASGTPQKLEEIAKAVSVISAEEMQNRDEYALSDLLRTVPGVVINNAGGPGQLSILRVRGLRTDAAAVLVDGLRFRDSTALQGDSSSFLSALNIIAPDHIEILRGSGSSLYGTNAVGGVVNVVTQEGGGPLHGDLLVEGGSLGMFRTRASASAGALHDRLKLSGGLLHLNITRGVDGNDAYRSTGGQAFLRYDIAPSINISARLWGSDDFVMNNASPSTSGIPSAAFPANGIIPAIPLSPANVAILNSGGRPDYSGATYVPGRDDPDSRRASRFFTGAFTLRQSWTARASWGASYQRVHTNRTYSNGPGGPGFQPAASNYSNYAGDIDTASLHAAMLVTPWMSLTGGYEFEREAYAETQRNNLPAPRTLAEKSNIHERSNAGYFAAQLNFLQRRLQVSLSGRMQAYNLLTPSFDYSGTANPYARVELLSPKTALTGDLAVAYMISRTETKLRAHFGNAYRAPSLYERFGAGFSNNPVSGLTTFTPYGDPRLASDRYNSLDGGIDQYLLRNRVRLSATYFYTRIVSLSAFDFSGAIQVATDPFGRSSGYINGAGGISRGAELSAETRPLKSLSVSASYTYVNARSDRDLSVSGFWGALQVPAHTASAVATKSWGHRLDTTFTISHYSSYLSPFFAGVRSRAFEFPGFTRASLVGSYRVWQGERGTVRGYAKVDNLFNERYYQNGWLAARGTVVIGMGYSR